MLFYFINTMVHQIGLVDDSQLDLYVQQAKKTSELAGWPNVMLTTGRECHLQHHMPDSLPCLLLSRSG